MYNLNLPLPADQMFAFALSPKRMAAYAVAAFLAFSFFWYVLWSLPISAWFRKPLEPGSQCPMCGSRDVRPSRVNNFIDRFRVKLGLFPFRCRGCTKRFVARSSDEIFDGMMSQLEIG
jgi:hypothetical protein